MSLVDRLNEALRTHALLSSVGELLGWDHEVCMPPAGAQHRSAVMGAFASLVHERWLKEVLPLLKEARNHPDLSPEQQRSIAILLRDAEPIEKLPLSWVRTFSETVTLAQSVWVEARDKSNFSLFAPHLEKIVQLLREKAEILGYQHEPYEALVYLYEPSIPIREIEKIFTELRSFLVQVIQLCREADLEGLNGTSLSMPAPLQRELVERIVQHLGYDLRKGRIDTSPHPFCVGFHPEDVRITIRIDENNLTMALFSALHEMGHALYEQGLPKEPLGWPMTHAASTSIHESQSRFWENHVGKSLAFWQYMYEKVLPSYRLPWLSYYTPLALARRINKVSPCLIRIESDEVSYHLHIILRFELERALINGQLAVRDLPAAWEEKIRDYLGLKVPSDREGVLQDIHWSMGNFGYFPTYSLGSLYAAQFAARLSQEHPDWQEALAQGEAEIPLQWMRKHIHAHGHLYDSQELCKIATGETLSARYFIQYIQAKIAQFYEGLCVHP